MDTNAVIPPAGGASGETYLAAHISDGIPRTIVAGRRRQYALAWASQGVSFVAMSSLHLLLPRLVGPALYGAFVSAFAASFAVFALIGPGYTFAVIQEAKGAEIAPLQRLRYVTWLVTILLLLGLPAALFAVHFGPPTPTPLALAAACWLFVPILGATHLLDCLMISHERNGESLAGRVVNAIALATFPVLFARLVPTSAAVLFAVGVAYLLAILAYARLLPGPSAWRHALDPAAPRAGLVAESVRFSIITSAGTVFASASLLVISTTVQPAVVGNVKLAWTIGTALTALLPFPQMLIFARFHRADSKASRAHDSTAQRLIAAVLATSLAAATVVALLGPPLIVHIYGSDFVLAASAVHWLAFLLVFQALDQPVIAALSSRLSTRTLAPHYAAGFLLGLFVLAVLTRANPVWIPIALLVGRAITTFFPLVTVGVRKWVSD